MTRQNIDGTDYVGKDNADPDAGLRKVNENFTELYDFRDEADDFYVNEADFNLPEDALTETDPLTNWPLGMSTMRASAVADWNGDEVPCVVATYNGSGVGWQTLGRGGGGSTPRWREWDDDDLLWKPWKSLASSAQVTNLPDQIYHIVPFPLDTWAESDELTSFPSGFSMMDVSDTADWGPNTGEAGHVLIERNGSTGKQTFSVPATETSYTRYYDSGAWGSWVSGGGWTAVDASTSTKGISKLSVAPASPTEPIAVGDNDSRMTNARTPTAHSHLIADLPVADDNESNTNEVVRSNDSRLSNSRAPTSHSHAIADLPVADSGESNVNELTRSNDARLSDQRTPSDSSVTNAKVDAAAAIAESKLNLASDAAAGTASRRTLGTGAQQAAAGNDSRLSDARTPTAHSHLIADLPVADDAESNANEVVRSNDSRLSNSRAPTSHSHLIADLPVADSGESNANEVVRSNDSRLSDARTPTSHNHDDRYFTETESDTRYIRTVNSIGPDGSGNVNVAGAGLSLTEVEVDLGSTPRTSGSFQITGLSGLPVDEPVLIRQGLGPYTGKGTLADEFEMDTLNVAGKVASASAIQCYWTTDSLVRGNFKFLYAVG